MKISSGKIARISRAMQSKSVIIEGVKYDISNFKHPGGNVIDYMIGEDATGPFKEFHYRSAKARSVLISLPHENLEMKKKSHDEDMLKDFYLFRADLERRGYFEPSYSHIFLRIVELLLIYSLAIFFIQRNVFVSVILFALFGGKCGWIQHEGGHLSLTGQKKVDNLIQDIFIGWGLAADSSLWNIKHNKHHATPQKVHHDYDIDQIPLAAFFDTAVETSRTKIKMNPFLRLWLRFQAYTYLPISCGLGYFVLLSYHFKNIFRQRNLFQLAIVIASFASRLALFYYVGSFSFAQSIALVILTCWAIGMFLSGHFFLSHSFQPIVDHNDNPNWVRYSFDHTVDINPQNFFINWIMGYLNCQVVHHLFPSMPQFRQPEVSLELMGWAKKWNIEYKVVGYFEAWQKVYENLNNVGIHYYNSANSSAKTN